MKTNLLWVFCVFLIASLAYGCSIHQVKKKDFYGKWYIINTESLVNKENMNVVFDSCSFFEFSDDSVRIRMPINAFVGFWKISNGSISVILNNKENEDFEFQFDSDGLLFLIERKVGVKFTLSMEKPDNCL